MKASRKRDLKLIAFAMLIGLVLGVWAMWPRPRTPVSQMRDAVNDLNRDTDAWLADLDRELER